jgi:hypothetical protein
MNVMQTQVTIAWESEKGDIGLTASKGQDSLVFFTHLTGPRWTRSTSPSRLRLLVLPHTLGLLESASRTWRPGWLVSAELEGLPQALAVRVYPSRQKFEPACPDYGECLVCSSSYRLLAAHGMRKVLRRSIPQLDTASSV